MSVPEQSRRARRSDRRGHRTRRRLAVLVVLLAAVIAAAWLQVDPGDPVPLVDEAEVSVIAHAGAQGHAPDNTMPAFDLALEQGADTLEMDLQLTADDEVVVIHDRTVDRTTDGTGAVGDLTLDEIKELDAGHAFERDGEHPFRGQGIEIPTLAEVLEAYPDTPLIIELKTDGGAAIIDPVLDLVEEHDRRDSVVVPSFDLDYVRTVRERMPGVRTNMPEAESTAFYLRQLVGLHPWWEAPGELLMVPEHHDADLGLVELTDVRVPTSRFVRAAERLGVHVQVWTVNDPAAMHRLLDAGVHGIMTDHPDRLVEVIAEREAERGVARGEDLSRYDGQLERAERLQDEWGWLTPVMEVVTFLGDEEFYLLAFPLLYWAVSRRLGLRLGVMLLLTAGLSSLAKLWFATPRPAFLAPGLGRVTETSFGLPSGHAQNAVAVWGLLAASLRSWWVRIALVALVAVISLSRIHLGVHFLEDTLAGWLAGAILLAAFLWLGPRVQAWWVRQRPAEQVLAAVAASLALVAPATLLSGRVQGWSFPWPGLDDVATTTGASGVVTPAGALAGLGVGLVVLRARGGFEVDGPPGRRALRVVVGLVGVVAIVEGLGALLPGGEDPLDLALRYLRYLLAAAWMVGVAPVVFVRLGLAPGGEPAGSETERSGAPPST